jgi:C4-type Zn-finger protein
MPFLHQDKIIPPDEFADPLAPDCPTCVTRMWLEGVSTKVEATEKISKRHYVCKQCGLTQIVTAREAI